MTNGKKQNYLGFLLLLFMIGCNDKTTIEQIQFEVLEGSQTGIHFSNALTSYPDFNMFKYMYFFNGAGLGAADFNNDGLTDLFFASNQGQNKLYLNMGNMKFKDVSADALIPNDNAWNTGVSVVDINGDGLMDIYLSRVGNFDRLQSKNQFLICTGINNGVPQYKDEAEALGLDFSAFGTQSAFFDFDLDGDLDMYMMNHSLRFNGTFNPRRQYENNYDTLAGDRLMRNDNGRFTDVSKSAGISGNIISYGLGLCISDINMDGYPDIYIGNDFHENDYMYINNKNGTFTDVLTEKTMQSSQFSMGVDIADITNDGLPEIITMDMLPYDPYLLKRSLGEDSYDLFNHKLNAGYHHQYARNTLQLNRGDNLFSEVARYSGVQATDWSWSALWTDFDNDGNKDLFVSNGIPKRMNDIDYVKFISDEKFQQKIRDNTISDADMAMLDVFPKIKIQNKFYKNITGAKFKDISKNIKNDKKTFSNGAVYADLDNDGDLDIVVNNIDDEALVYENKQNSFENKWLKIHANATKLNSHAIGAKALVFIGDKICTYENHTVKGFLSSMILPLNIGLGPSVPDSIYYIWPDNTYFKLANIKYNTLINLTYKVGLPKFDYSVFQKRKPLIKSEDLTTQLGLKHKHNENSFIEFNRESLIPHMVSREGPALVAGDINGDGLEDFYIGSCKFDTATLYIQTRSGKFIKSRQPDFEMDNAFEDVDARFADVNNDNFPDLIVASGGNEFSAVSPMLAQRVYLNNGEGHFNKKIDAFPEELRLTANVVTCLDYNFDGYIDLFFGARAVPSGYGISPQSYLLINDGHGKFSIDIKQSKLLSESGFVTDAYAIDFNKDGKDDILIATEWGPLYWFESSSQGFTKKLLTDKKGWWNFIFPVDLDNDGDIDIIAGNLGQNNKFGVSNTTPLRMYFEDFDDNGKKEQIITYYVEGKEIIFNTHEELLKQMPILKKRYLFAEDFAKAELMDFLTKQKMLSATIYEANYFSNAILINDGNYNFEISELPMESQLSCMKSCSVFDYNQDGLPDIFIGGNFYHNNIQMGRYDADYGSLLINKGKCRFDYLCMYHQPIKGEIRKIVPIAVGKEKIQLIAKNNDILQAIKFKK